MTETERFGSRVGSLCWLALGYWGLKWTGVPPLVFVALLLGWWCFLDVVRHSQAVPEKTEE